MFSTEDIPCMYMRILVLVVLVFTMTAFAQSVTPPGVPGNGGIANYGFVGDWFQVKYFPNLGIPSGAYINITNTGRSGGNICVNVYGFNAAEEMFACCNCLVTPDGLKSLNVFTDLVGHALTPAAPAEAVVKLAATAPANCTATVGSVTPANLALGMRAWGTALHALPTSPVTYGITETEFSMADLGLAEVNNLNLYCSVIQVVGSGYGTCASCKASGLGASVQ
jgi:hypothetical protein